MKPGPRSISLLGGRERKRDRESACVRGYWKKDRERGKSRERPRARQHSPKEKASDRSSSSSSSSSSRLLDLLNTRDLFVGASYLAWKEREGARGSREESVMIGEMIIFKVRAWKGDCEIKEGNVTFAIMTLKNL